MIATLQCVVLDCPDVAELSHFYRSLLGGTVNHPDPRWLLDDDWSTLHTPNGVVLAFQRVPDYRPPQWPNPDHPAQFHLDLGVEDLPRSHQEALANGATLLDDGGGTRSWRVYADPAGHPFCLTQD